MKNNRITAFLLALIMTAAVSVGCAEKAKPDSSLQQPPTEVAVSIETDTSKADDTKLESYGLKDDYYAYVNAKLLSEHGTETWNHFFDLMDKSYSEQKLIIQNAAGNLDCYDKTSSEYKLGSLYKKATENNKNSISDFDKLFEPVMNADNIPDFLTELAKLQYNYGVDTLFNMEVLAPDENPGEYMVFLKPLNYFHDAEDYHDEDVDEFSIDVAEDNKAYFTEYMQRLLKLADKDTSSVDKVYEFVRVVAKSENSDTYQAVKLENVQRQIPNINLKNYLSGIFKSVPNEFMAKDISAYTKLNEYITEDNLNMLKNYVYMINLSKYADYLGSDFVKVKNEMEEMYIGDVENSDMEKMLVQQVSDLLKWDMGKLYTEKNFSKDKQENIQKIVGDLIAEYKSMIGEEDWLSDETKTKSIKKLEGIKIRIGMPDDIGLYLSAYQPANDGYFADVMQIKSMDTRKQYDNYSVKVDRNIWNVLPQEMTPCYYPTDNSINIPVAALEAPYFSSTASEEENLGAIGTIIGHEITHAFDDLGSKYDENGDLNNWWTSNDKEAFEARAGKIVSYYYRYKTPGIMRQDGEQTLGENIADLGSMNCLSRIVKRKGLNAEKFFESYANSWASTTDDLSAAMMSGMDEHAADKVRVNAVLSSCDLFYETYHLSEQDKMFIKSSERVKLW